MKEEDKDLNYWKENAKDEYVNTPICVLRYITELEQAASCIEGVSDEHVKLVNDFAAWSKKYPRDRVYHISRINMDDELQKLENRAKELPEPKN